MHRHFKILYFALVAKCARAALDIIPGATWTATNTVQHIQAHGAGLIEEDGTYYMIGEEKTDGTLFQAVNCYSSTNLIEWTFVNQLLTVTEEEGADLGPNRIVERPKIIKNDNTGQYVMWMHIDSTDYADARVGVATGDSVCGDYVYRESFRPLGFQSRDIGLFKDGDGSAYLLSEDRAYGTRIIRLTDDYLDVANVTFGWEYFAESPALIKRGETYFIFGSHLTGWSPNDNIYSTATSLSGPWTNWTEFAPVGSNTFSSQVNYVLPLGADKAIYMGDRWVSSNLGASTYIWLPLQIDGTTATASLAWYDSWSVDLASGTWSAEEGETVYEGEDGALSGGARLIDCSRCSGSTATGYIGGAGDGENDGAVTLEVDYATQSTDSTRVTLNIHYLNGDTDPRYAAVSVNDGEAQTIAFLSTNQLSGSGSSAVHVDLVQGVNTVQISGVEGGGWGPDVDQVVVPL
ncbi:glycosyl hydrolase family 43 protein [Aspergillus foveolatus]|uniref:glycosyl hydrolase family 43 protein n=1 Tax=Aspergillus foveolatus TaxID=210207 RepID=UPI003CCCC8BA